MNIRFVSTLTPDDENLLAPGLLKAIAALLETTPIAYMLRIDTADGQVHQFSRTAHVGPTIPPASPVPDSLPDDFEALVLPPIPAQPFDS